MMPGNEPARAWCPTRRTTPHLGVEAGHRGGRRAAGAAHHAAARVDLVDHEIAEVLDAVVLLDDHLAGAALEGAGRPRRWRPASSGAGCAGSPCPSRITSCQRTSPEMPSMSTLRKTFMTASLSERGGAAPSARRGPPRRPRTTRSPARSSAGETGRSSGLKPRGVRQEAAQLRAARSARAARRCPPRRGASRASRRAPRGAAGGGGSTGSASPSSRRSASWSAVLAARSRPRTTRVTPARASSTIEARW